MRRIPCTPVLLVLSLALAAAHPVRAIAQDAPGPPPQAGACYGFTFGTWSPPLDSARRYVDTSGSVRPGGIGDATTTRDSLLILFPPWWPVGIGVQFSSPLGSRDTLDGTAYAFVSDGRATSPRTTVRAWRKPCGAPMPAARPRPAAPPAW